MKGDDVVTLQFTRDEFSVFTQHLVQNMSGQAFNMAVVSLNLAEIRSRQLQKTEEPAAGEVTPNH